MKTKTTSKFDIKGFGIDENEEKKLVINDGEIEIVFKHLYHFEIVKFILDKMKTSSIGKTTGKEVEDFLKTQKKRQKSIKFISFLSNIWDKHFTKGHKNSWYFYVTYNGKVWDQDSKRRNFLSNFFLHDGSKYFWLNVPIEVLTIQPYSKYLQSLKEKFESEFPTPTSVLTSDYVELEALSLKARKTEEQIKPIEPPKDISKVIKNNKTLAIVGDAGSGKSFTLHKIVMDCANNRLPWIPVYVKLLNVPLPKGLENWIDLCFFENFDPNLTIDKLKSENNKETFIFLFDGLDEAGSPNDRHDMESAILNLMGQFKESRCIITTRPIGYEKELPNFETFEIESLNKQIPEFVSKFFKEDKEKRDKVLSYLEDKKFKELASNPYQLFLICDTVKNDGELPCNKGQVFKNFIKSIKNQREKPKGERGLYEHFPLLEKIFKETAFQIMDGDMKYIAEETLCSIIKKAKEEQKEPYYQNFLPTKILNEYIIRSGFMCKIYDKDRNVAGYNFIHLSWRDYFTACYLKELGMEDMLQKIQEKILPYWREYNR